MGWVLTLSFSASSVMCTATAAGEASRPCCFKNALHRSLICASSLRSLRVSNSQSLQVESFHLAHTLLLMVAVVVVAAVVSSSLLGFLDDMLMNVVYDPWMTDGRERMPRGTARYPSSDPSVSHQQPSPITHHQQHLGLLTMAPVLSFVFSSLLAARQNVWFIDGNNLMAQRGVPHSREAVSDKLQDIEKSKVFLVFDGRHDETLSEKWDKDSDMEAFCTVVTDSGFTADDYILEAMEDYVATAKSQKVHVVTADRRFRKRIVARKDVDATLVNPITFWRRYRPRLTGLKK